MVAPLKPIGGETKIQVLVDPLVFLFSRFKKKNDFGLERCDAESWQPSVIKPSNIFWLGSCKVCHERYLLSHSYASWVI